MERLLRFWRWFTRDQDGRVVIAEKPNPPILIAIIGFLLSHLLSADWAKTGFRVIAILSLVAWATLEIGWGHSPFRRALGVVILVAGLVFIVW